MLQAILHVFLLIQFFYLVCNDNLDKSCGVNMYLCFENNVPLFYCWRLISEAIYSVEDIRPCAVALGADSWLGLTSCQVGPLIVASWEYFLYFVFVDGAVWLWMFITLIKAEWSCLVAFQLSEEVMHRLLIHKRGVHYLQGTSTGTEKANQYLLPLRFK